MKYNTICLSLFVLCIFAIASSDAAFYKDKACLGNFDGLQEIDVQNETVEGKKISLMKIACVCALYWQNEKDLNTGAEQNYIQCLDKYYRSWIWMTGYASFQRARA